MPAIYHVQLTGPLDFADRVAAKLAGYTWNLLDENSLDFAILVDESGTHFDETCVDVCHPDVIEHSAQLDPIEQRSVA